MLGRQVVTAMNTLHLHFIHQFEVKSGVAVRAEALTQGSYESAESRDDVEIGPPRG